MRKQKIDFGVGTITAGRPAFTSVGVIALRENSTPVCVDRVTRNTPLDPASVTWRLQQAAGIAWKNDPAP
ncbi:MAG: hypothetical protein J7454_10640 [Roseiflexus sp.]|jgi:hypothetical protein|nr:hypothetical protein [Roseiflexus sp.]